MTPYRKVHFFLDPSSLASFALSLCLSLSLSLYALSGHSTDQPVGYLPVWPFSSALTSRPADCVVYRLVQLSH